MDPGNGFGEALTADELLVHEQFGTRLCRRGHVVWMALGGELDIFTAPQLKTALEQAGLERDDELVLDLRGLTFVDSSGLAGILGAHERALKEGREPVRLLIRGSAPVEALFETIGAGDYLHLIDDPSELTGVRA
jgi:anti-sigma B factor antagonist